MPLRHLTMRPSLRCLVGLLSIIATLGLMSHPAWADKLQIDKLQTDKVQTDTVQVEKEVVYGTIDDVQLRLDVYQPDGFSGKRPAILQVHGGSWSGGDKRESAKLLESLAQKGYVVFAVNYRLAPKFQYPAQVDDVQRAVRWIRANADKYNVDPERIGALGDSAGGHLVAMLGTRDTRDNADKALAAYSSRVQCVVDLYGPTDFTDAIPTTGVNPLVLMILKNFFGKSREEAPEIYRDGSPILYVSKKSAPFLILHGDKDSLVPLDQSKRLHEALQKAGVASTLVVMENDGHGFVRLENQEKMKRLIAEFFARYLKP